MDPLTAALVQGGGTVGMLTFLFVALAKGWLVTRREADSYRENEQIWRAAYDAKVAADSMTKEQFNELLEGSRTSRAFIESFMKAVEH